MSRATVSPENPPEKQPENQTSNQPDSDGCAYLLAHHRAVLARIQALKAANRAQLGAVSGRNAFAGLEMTAGALAAAERILTILR